jgi:ankyrin repeat protein
MIARALSLPLALLLAMASAQAQVPPTAAEAARYAGLHAAAHLGHDGAARQLIAAGAPLDHVNNLHWTAVIEAVVLGDGGKRHRATLAALIAAKANLQLPDRQGRTPLQLARTRGYREVAKMLEDPGAR